MRRTTTAMLAGLLLLPALTAADKPAAPSEQLETLKKEVASAKQQFYQAYQKAKTDEERQELLKEFQGKETKQIHDSARRALEVARKHPNDAVAVEALCWIITGGLGYQAAGAEIETAFDLLRKDHVTSDKLALVCHMTAVFEYRSTKPERLLRDVIEKNPHHEMQARACLALARLLRRQAIGAKLVRDPAEAKRLGNFVNADVLEHYKSSDPDKLGKEAEDLLERVAAKYPDVKSSRGTLGEQAKAELFEIRYLVIGKTAPEIEGEDIDGNRFKLSDYHGKVVVLDFWGNW